MRLKSLRHCVSQLNRFITVLDEACGNHHRLVGTTCQLARHLAAKAPELKLGGGLVAAHVVIRPGVQIRSLSFERCTPVRSTVRRRRVTVPRGARRRSSVASRNREGSDPATPLVGPSRRRHSPLVGEKLGIMPLYGLCFAILPLFLESLFVRVPLSNTLHTL